jgi:hypothetical protein
MLAAMIASTHASLINADVQEFNILTFEQDEHVPWDTTHEIDAEVPTLIHGSLTFIVASFAEK